MMEKQMRNLIKGAIRGERRSLEKVVEIYYRDILYFAVSQSNRQEAEDITQQTIVSIYEGIGKLKDPEKCKVWIMQVAYNVCLKHMKKTRTQQAHIDYEAMTDQPSTGEEIDFLPEEYIVNEESRKYILNIIHTLPKYQQFCLQYHYFNTMKPAEIAEVMGLEVKTVYNALNNGKKNLKKAIEEQSGKQLVFTVLPVGAVPALTQIFRIEQQNLLGVEWSSAVWENIQYHCTNLKIPSGSGGHLSVSGKIVIGIAGCVAAGGLLIYMNQKSPETESQNPPVIVAEEPEAIEEEPEIVEEDITGINTLEEMIGVQESEQLKSYVASGIEVAAWDAFIDKIQAERLDMAEDFEYTYTSYLLEKQDKRLILAVRRPSDGIQLQVLYYFGDKSEPQMEMEQFILLFDSE